MHFTVTLNLGVVVLNRDTGAYEDAQAADVAHSLNRWLEELIEQSIPVADIHGTRQIMAVQVRSLTAREERS